MSAPTPESDDSYPASWRPSWIKRRDQEYAEIELALGAMDPRDRAALLKRVEENN